MLLRAAKGTVTTQALDITCYTSGKRTSGFLGTFRTCDYAFEFEDGRFTNITGTSIRVEGADGKIGKEGIKPMPNT
jgi:hypothetical protein